MLASHLGISHKRGFKCLSDFGNAPCQYLSQGRITFLTLTKSCRRGSGGKHRNNFPARRPSEHFGGIPDVQDPKCWKHHPVLSGFLSELQCGEESAPHLLTSGPRDINGKSSSLLQLHPKTASISPWQLMRTELGESFSTVPRDKSAACLLSHVILFLVETSQRHKERDSKIVWLLLIYLAMNSMD